MTSTVELSPPVLDISDGDSSLSWRRWKRKWDAYVVKSKLASQDAEEQLASLTFALSDEVQDIVENLPYERDEDKKDITKILELLEAHLADQINEIYESFRFFRRDQQVDENIMDYVSAVRTLAASCQFGNLQERLIRDRIVCGIRNKALQKSFLEDSKLTLKVCVDRCRAAERADSQFKEIVAERAPQRADYDEACAMETEINFI